MNSSHIWFCLFSESHEELVEAKEVEVALSTVYLPKNRSREGAKEEMSSGRIRDLKAKEASGGTDKVYSPYDFLILFVNQSNFLDFICTWR